VHCYERKGKPDKHFVVLYFKIKNILAAYFMIFTDDYLNNTTNQPRSKDFAKHYYNNTTFGAIIICILTRLSFTIMDPQEYSHASFFEVKLTIIISLNISVSIDRWCIDDYIIFDDHLRLISVIV